MESASDKYIREHSTPQSEALEWIEKQTNIHTNYPRMLSGRVQGRFLTMLTELCGAREVLEIGCFTGYSALCFAYGVGEGGRVDTLEINDELEELTRRGWERSGIADRITLHIGDALDTLKTLSAEGRCYDLVYIDANKREYPDYYEAVMPLLRQGGLILADDTILGGKVCQDPVPTDKQTQGLVRFNEALASDSRVECVMLPIRDGLTLVRKL